MDALTQSNDRIGNQLASEFESLTGGSSKTFWRAVDDLTEAGEMIHEGGKGTGKQVTLHLVRPEAEADPDRPF